MDVNIDHEILKFVDVWNILSMFFWFESFPSIGLVEVILVKNVFSQLVENKLIESNKSSEEKLVLKLSFRAFVDQCQRLRPCISQNLPNLLIEIQFPLKCPIGPYLLNYTQVDYILCNLVKILSFRSIFFC